MNLWITVLPVDESYHYLYQKGTFPMPTKETDLKAIWLEILTKVQESLSKVACEKWLMPVRPIRLDERTLELAAPNDFSKD